MGDLWLELAQDIIELIENNKDNPEQALAEYIKNEIEDCIVPEWVRTTESKISIVSTGKTYSDTPLSKGIDSSLIVHKLIPRFAHSIVRILRLRLAVRTS